MFCSHCITRMYSGGTSALSDYLMETLIHCLGIAWLMYCTEIVQVLHTYCLHNVKEFKTHCISIVHMLSFMIYILYEYCTHIVKVLHTHCIHHVQVLHTPCTIIAHTFDRCYVHIVYTMFKYSRHIVYVL